MFIGIDYGLKRVGIAVSDEADKVAFPFEVMPEPRALGALLGLARERQAAGFVLGESKNFAGEDNEIMVRIRRFGEELKAAGIPVHFELEFLTSAHAARQHGPKGKKPSLDASAAALILQSFLDKRAADGKRTSAPDK